jgi:hypothetical protein
MARVFEPKQTIGDPSSNEVLDDNDYVFTLEKNFRGFIQNLGTYPLKVRLGGSKASATRFNLILAPGAVNDDGQGATVWIDDFIGRVSVFGDSPRYVAWRRAI